MSTCELDKIAARIRYKIIQLSSANKVTHLASSLSCIDILVGLYWNYLNVNKSNISAENRDRFIISKGHAALALYATLNERGLWDEGLIDTVTLPNSPIAEHPGPHCAPGVEWATGSLGHGLGAGMGMALSSRILKTPYKVAVLVGDGECNEGSVWEAAQFAPMHKLNNLTAIVDFNKWQATGRSLEITSLDPLVDRWKAFGWEALEINGHDFAEINNALDLKTDKPKAIIANTIKGKGVSFMEDDNNWHYRTPKPEEVELARKELGV